LGYELLVNKTSALKEKLAKVLPYFSIFAGFLILKFAVMAPREIHRIDHDPLIYGVEPLRLIVSTTIEYLSILFAPVSFSVDRYLPVLKTIFAAKAIMFYILGAGFVYALAKLKGSGRLIFAAAFIIICLGPVSNIIPIEGRAFAEQRLYLPSVGWALLFGGLLGPLMEGFAFSQISTLLTFAALTVTLAYFSVIVIKRNVVWLDPINLWKAAVMEKPEDARAWMNLAGTYLERGEFKKAESFLNQLMKHPESRSAGGIYINMGIIEQNRGNIKKALQLFLAAAKLSPDNFEAWSNAGSMYLLSGDNQNALAAYKKAAELEPTARGAGVLVNLGIIQLKMKDFQKAKESFAKAVELNPDMLEARENLANIYRTLGLAYEASEQEREINLRSKTGSRLQKYNPVVQIQ